MLQLILVFLALAQPGITPSGNEENELSGNYHCQSSGSFPLEDQDQIEFLSEKLRNAGNSLRRGALRPSGSLVQHFQLKAVSRMHMVSDKPSTRYLELDLKNCPIRNGTFQFPITCENSESDWRRVWVACFGLGGEG